MFMALLLMVAAVLACNLGDETDKANKLVDEGNAAIGDAKKFIAEAEDKKAKMIDAVSAIKDDADLAAARSIAKEAIAAYDKTKAKCDETAKKFEEASKLKIKDKFKEYLLIKVKEFQKRAELVAAAKGAPQALIDSDNKSAFDTAMKAADEKVDKLSKEADDLAAQGTKIQKDNPDVFKS
jgi:hypothetical protein